MITRQKKRSTGGVRKPGKPVPEPTWIVVAQRAKAKILEYPGKGRTLKIVSGYTNPLAELQTRQLISDKPGRSYSQSTGRRRHAMSSAEDAHERAFTVFAKDLAKTVERGLADGACKRVVVVAEPHCAGKISKSLGKRGQSRIDALVKKDLFRLTNERLFATLKNVLHVTI